MNGTSVIDELRGAIRELKAAGQSMVAVDALLQYLDSLQKEVTSEDQITQREHETHLTVFRTNHETQMKAYDAQLSHKMEMIRSVLSYGAASLKSATVINGGAAVALLAFLGNIWAKTTSPTVASSLALSLLLFTLGVLCAAISTGLTYVTQYLYAYNHTAFGIAFHTITVLLVVASFSLFGVGAAVSYTAFKSHLTPGVM